MRGKKKERVARSGAFRGISRVGCMRGAARGWAGVGGRLFIFTPRRFPLQVLFTPSSINATGGPPWPPHFRLRLISRNTCNPFDVGRASEVPLIGAGRPSIGKKRRKMPYSPKRTYSTDRPPPTHPRPPFTTTATVGILRGKSRLFPITAIWMSPNPLA